MMRITKRQLRSIVKEEKQKIISERSGGAVGSTDTASILYNVLIPALQAEGVQGPALVETLRDAADLLESEMREMLG
jgi:hypothetical protein